MQVTITPNKTSSESQRVSSNQQKSKQSEVITGTQAPKQWINEEIRPPPLLVIILEDLF